MADLLGPKMNKKKQKWTPCDFGNDTLTPCQQGTLGQLALSVVLEILCVYEACKKFPKGGMYATLPQALLQSWIHFLRLQQSSLTAATIQCCQEKKALKYTKKNKSGHRVRTQRVN